MEQSLFCKGLTNPWL